VREAASGERREKAVAFLIARRSSLVALEFLNRFHARRRDNDSTTFPQELWKSLWIN
jgi:hypothetical protein